MTELKRQFIDQLLAEHPGLGDRPRSFYEEKVADNLLSPFTVTLPATLRAEMQAAAAVFFRLREALRPRVGDDFPDPGNRSIMMSYDFHLDERGQLKLIEINTNAAFLILSWEMYRLRGLPYPADFSPARFREDILEEWRLSRAFSGGEHPRVAIVDEKPEEQRLFIEFLVAREWMRGYGWEVSIRDVADAMTGPSPDFIYNRDTDFNLENPASSALRDAFLTRKVCLSPNPYEYNLLADKQRLVDWGRPGFFESLGLSSEDVAHLRRLLPASHDLSELSADELWARRKHLFFKPKREYGSKKAFRGASISHKVFQELLKEDPLAQEFVPAPELTFETPEGPQAFKFDLRCHAYADRLEGALARVYQGQVTNLKTPHGGFAPVVFK